MLLNFDEFDKIVNVCTQIFTCWDDEYEKLVLFLKDVVKKGPKKEDLIKVFLQINPAHKQLQIRLERVKK